MKPDVRAALAYLLGAYLSDGSLSWDCDDPHPTWHVKDEAFADCVSIALATIGSPHALKRTKRGYYKIWEHAKGKLGLWLHEVSPKKDHLPVVPKDLVRPLVAGLMDGDGCISKRLKLTFCGGKGFVFDFYDLLKSLDVCQGALRFRDLSVENTEWSDLWRWSIDKESFLKAGLCFAMPRKQERLALWCCRTQRTALSRGYSRDLQRAKVAKWWMREVYAPEQFRAIPGGR